MKKWLVGLIVFGMMVVPAMAHPGGTDSSGGHYNRSTGEYHYHHGYSAHDHKDGVCPYDYDDKTGERSGSSGGSSYSYTSYAAAEDWYDEYCDAQEARRAAEKELQEMKHNQLRNLALSAAAGLCGGLSVLIVQISASKRRLKETEQRLLEQAKISCNIQVSKLTSEWQQKLAEEERSKALLIENHAQLTDGRRELQMICLEEVKQTIGRMVKPVSDYEFQLELEYLNSNIEDAFELPVEPDISAGVVYVQQDLQGGKYHYDVSCCGRKMILVGKKSAERLGFGACKTCTHGVQPTSEYKVIVSQYGYTIYHEIGSCLKSGGVVISLSDAKRRNLKPCPRCKPPAESPRIWF